jgi:hypothetical protein
MAHDSMSHTDTRMQACIDDCLRCYSTCEATIANCLEMGGDHAEAAHIRLLSDCARICLLSADFMVRQSGFHGQVCGLCAEICRQCAADCERIDSSDEAMAKCAAECRTCAESCEAMTRAA